MSQYKKMIAASGRAQHDLLPIVRNVETRIDKPLLSRIVNGVVLPTPPVLNALCAALGCRPLDIYKRREITLASRSAGGGTARKRNVYNFSAEVDPAVVARIFETDNAAMLGIPANKTDFLRGVLAELDAKLTEIKKAAGGGDEASAHGEVKSTK